MSTPALWPRVTVDEYYRLAETGVLDPDQRVELIDGEVVEMSPIGSRHLRTVNRLTRLFVQAISQDQAVVSIQNPVRLSQMSELQPDVALLRPELDDNRAETPRPADVLLLVEVSDTTARKDRAIKRPLYAAAGIAEVWIVDLEFGMIEIATDPTPEGYRSLRRAGRGAVMSPVAFPSVAFAVDDILH